MERALNAATYAWVGTGLFWIWESFHMVTTHGFGRSGYESLRDAFNANPFSHEGLYVASSIAFLVPLILLFALAGAASEVRKRRERTALSQDGDVEEPVLREEGPDTFMQLQRLIRKS